MGGGKSRKRSGKKRGGTRRKCGGTPAVSILGGAAAIAPVAGGNGRCCFKAKTCNSRKKRGNRKRKFKSGRCCLPISMKKCGVSKRRR